MRGVTYSIEFFTPTGENVTLTNVKMVDLISKIHGLILEHYRLKISISKYMVYNLISRPNNVSRLLKQMIKINIE